MTARIERVVVVLDAVSESRTAIDTATRLAARWRARLHGVFVEDDELLRLANLPFARQVSLGAGVETLTRQQAERQLRAFAEQARRDIAAAAQRLNVEWSFDVVHGGASAGVAVASTTDFLVAGTATRPIGGHFRVESRWWSAVAPAVSSFLLSSRMWDRHGAVVALVQNRKPATDRLLDAAAQLAETGGRQLTVICPSELAEDEAFVAWLSKRLAGYSVPVEIDLAPSEPAEVIRRIIDLDCRLLAIASTDVHAKPEHLRNLIAHAACDVVVIR
jgi:nucleotide-binding universal stress UspA family protein